MIPGLDVDRFKGTVSSVFGEATLYINGREVDYREVQSLRTSDVERIEYFDFPSGEYAGDVASINFVTKELTYGGYVSVDGKQTIGFLGGDYNLVSKLVKGQTSYTLFGGHSMTKYNGVESNVQEEFIFTDYTVNRERNTYDALTKNNNQYLQFLVENKNDKRTLSAKAAMVRNESPENTSFSELAYSGYYTANTISNGIFH